MIGIQNFGDQELGGETKLSIPEGIRRYVSDLVSELDGITTRVFYLRRPQSAKEMPCVVIDKQDENRVHCLGSKSPRATYHFTISVWSYDPVEADAIYAAVRNGMEHFSGYWYGHKVCSVWIETDSDGADDPNDGSDDWVYGKTTSYGMVVDD